MRFVFRLEVSPEIGTGHFFRCFALAQQLIDSGWAEQSQIIFVARSISKDFDQILISEGIKCINLSQIQDYLCRADEKTWLGADPAQDAIEFSNTLSLRESDVVFVDSYAANAEWCDYINSRVATTVSFEDFGLQGINTDYVVRGNFLGNGESPNLDLHASEYLDGTKYLVMRKELQGLSSVVRKDLNVVLIYFGGADADNFTTRAVEAVLSSKYSGQIKVVVGNSFQYFDELNHRCVGEKRITIEVQPQNFIELMQTSSLCIGAGGLNLWERILLGLPSITVAIVPNQEPQVMSAKEHGLIFDVDPNNMPSRLRELLNTLFYHTEILRAQSYKCLQFMDCLGSHRVITRVLSQHLKVREAGVEDETLIHTLRNHPVARTASINKDEISIEAHKNWFKNALTRDDFLLGIAEVAGQPLGVVSFTEETIGTFRVSIYLNQFTKKSCGMGQYILIAAEKMLPRQSRFVATVLGENISSQRLFDRLNYRLERCEFSKGSNS
jgi:UDP-2,4-diacetamido-2,4,6-trideoxy-beta-L-altropyranose hydrolase